MRCAVQIRYIAEKTPTWKRGTETAALCSNLEQARESMPVKERIRMTMDRQYSLMHHTGLVIALACLALVSGCATGSTVDTSSRTHFIQIREQVTPQNLYVYVGDEVRWQNLRPDPVKVSLLSHHRLDLVSCEKGFTRLGTMEDTAMIPPREYVSLCFSQPGTIQYNVWLNPENPRGSMTPTANIQVSTIPAVRK
jgi:plastocyanin